MDPTRIHIGTARWNIPFDPGLRTDPTRKRESSLARYARTLGASEVNSSFYRHHRTSTWARWAATTPPGFRFSLKLPRSVTHDARLDPDVAGPVLAQLREEVAPLGDKLGPLLVQLPPSLRFDAGRVAAFLDEVDARWPGAVTCEPRHASWFDGAADELLASHGVARVAADPELAPGAGEPGGARELVYVRLHGSPRMYHSAYGPARVTELAERLRDWCGTAEECWCTFDNTASGAALDDALELMRLLDVAPPTPAAAPREEAAAPAYRIISTF